MPNEDAVGELTDEAMLRRLRGRRVVLPLRLNREKARKSSASDESAKSESDSIEPSLLEKES